jgi:hypothetical protein
VPELEVAAVRPHGLQGCNLHLDLLNLLLHISNVLQQRQSLNLVSIGILLEVMNLRLKIHDPLETVTSF